MFEIGEYVVYGNKGVCEVKDIGAINIPGMSQEKQYYTLLQVFSRGSKIMTPVDSDKVVLRKVIDAKKAKKLLDKIDDLNPVWIQNDKEREQLFTEIIRSADTEKLFEMMVALAKRKERRIADGKKATSTDERFYHAAEDILFGEMSISLDKSREEVKKLIREKMESLA